MPSPNFVSMQLTKAGMSGRDKEAIVDRGIRIKINITIRMNDAVARKGINMIDDMMNIVFVTVLYVSTQWIIPDSVNMQVSKADMSGKNKGAIVDCGIRIEINVTTRLNNAVVRTGVIILGIPMMEEITSTAVSTGGMIKLTLCGGVENPEAVPTSSRH